MKVYDAPPTEWAEERAKAEVSASSGKPEKKGLTLGRVGQIVGEEATRAAKKTADLPRRAGRLGLGLDRPQSMEDYQMMALMTTPAMAGGGAAAARLGLPRLLGEMTTAGAIGGGQAAMRGEDPTWPALADAVLTGASAGGAKLAGGVLEHLGRPAVKRAGSEAARAAIQAQRGQIEGAAKMLEQGKTAAAEKIGHDVAWLLPELETFHANELWGMTKEWGPAQIRRAFSPVIGQVEDKIGRRIGAGIAHPKLTVPTISDKPISVTQAIEGLIDASKETRGQVRNEILASLRVWDPSGEAGNLLTQAMKLRAAGYTYVNTIKNGLDKSGNLDPEKLATFINKNAEKLSLYAGEYWPHLEKILLRGGKAPVPVGGAKLPTIPALPELAADPSLLSRGAEKAARVTLDPATRAALGAGSVIPIGESGIPITGALLAGGLEGTGGAEALKHVPGGRLFLKTTGIESEGD